MISDGRVLTDPGSIAASRGLRQPVGREAPVDEIVSLVDPSSFAADQYRTLRHALERDRGDGGARVLAVTSPGAGDGKTVTTLNLAGTLARNRDLRVLVIDADLRRPALAAYLGLRGDGARGLADLLQDPDAAIDEVICRLDRFNLAVLPAGSCAAAYDLLTSARLESTIREARRRYDYVLIDTPPLVPVPDWRLVAPWVDGFLLVVAAHRTPRHAVARALNLLDPARTFGIVFNGDDAPGWRQDGYDGYYAPAPRDRSRRRWWSRV